MTEPTSAPETGATDQTQADTLPTPAKPHSTILDAAGNPIHGGSGPDPAGVFGPEHQRKFHRVHPRLVVMPIPMPHVLVDACPGCGDGLVIPGKQLFDQVNSQDPVRPVIQCPQCNATIRLETPTKLERVNAPSVKQAKRLGLMK